MSYKTEKPRDFSLIFYLWFIITIAAYAFGIYSIYQLLGVKPELTDWITRKIGEGVDFVKNNQYVWWGVGIAAGLLLLGIIVAYLEIWLFSYIGAEFITGTIFGGTVLLLVAGGYITWKVHTWIGVAVLIPAVLIAFIVLLISRRIILGAKIFEMSCEAVNEHKETLIPVIFFAFMGAFTAITGAAGAVFVGANLDKLPTESKWVQYLVFFLVIFVYMGIYWVMLYFSDAVNICIFKRWNNYKEANLKTAIKEVWKVKGSIVLFGLMMAFFHWLIFVYNWFTQKKVSKESKFYKVWNVMAKILMVIFFIVYLLLKLLLKIIKFLNYYTLTIIVVEKQGFIHSVARSSELAMESAADIIIGEIGVNIAKWLFNLMTFSIFAGGGFFLGYYKLADIFGITENGQTAVLVFSFGVAAVFFFFGYWPTVALLRPISTAYQTILFFYITDPIRGYADRKSRVGDSEDIANSISRVREKVMEKYDKESREVYGKKPLEASS